MGRQRQEAPPLLPHKASGQFYVRLDGKPKYLGRDREQAEQERRRLLAERLLRGPDAGPVRDPRTRTVAEVCAACLKYAEGNYSPKQMSRVRQSLLAVSEAYGTRPVAEFDQVALAAVRQHLLARPHERKPHLKLARNTVNRMVGAVQTLWAWAATVGLVPADKALALRLVRGVREGKGGRETPDVLAVPDEVVDATLPRLNPTVRAMVQLQRLTGMRPGEVCGMLRGELSTSPDEPVRSVRGLTVRSLDVGGVPVWVYAPGEHKTRHRGKTRVVAIGPLAQEVLRPFLDRPDDAHLFSPAEARERQLQARREARKTRVQPSQAKRRPKKHPSRRPGGHYTASSYGHAVADACKALPALERARGRAARPARGAVPHWSPNQIRHAVSTAVNDEYDQAHAQAVLGHATPNTTRLYIDSHLAKAATVAAARG